jgi:hypothetical protein
MSLGPKLFHLQAKNGQSKLINILVWKKSAKNLKLEDEMKIFHENKQTILNVI